MKMDDNQVLQAVLPAAKGGLGVSSARLLALTALLASAIGAKDALSEIFCSHSVCFRTLTPLKDQSEATRRFDARSMGCW